MDFNKNEEFNPQEVVMERDSQMDDPEMMPYDIEYGYGHGIMPHGSDQMYGESSMHYGAHQMHAESNMPYEYQQMYGQGTMPYGDQPMYGQSTSPYWMQGMNYYPSMQNYPMTYGQQMMPEAMHRQEGILPLLFLGGLGDYAFGGSFYPYYYPYYPPYYAPYFHPYY